jgi:nucleotide-binding universal stress UspA family protein
MSILCGTDFSEAAHEALTAAAYIAVRTQTPLHVVHSVQAGHPRPEVEPKSEYLDWVLRQLHREADRARELGADVHVHLKQGSPDEAMLGLAEEHATQLIVIGPLGGRSPGTFALGGHADRLIQRAHVPVLIVRTAEPFRAWLRDEQPLRIVMGADLSRSTEAAMAAVQRWSRISACDVTAVHLYWPPEQFARLGIEGVRSYLDPDPDVTKTLTRELTHRLGQVDESTELRVHVEPHLGRPGDRLADIAFQRKADVLVVGSHGRNALQRFWEGSVSRWAVHAARTSVLCVPAPRAPAALEVPHMRNVLAATDLSPAGNAAVALAYALTEVGGTVHLVQVVPAKGVAPLSPHDIFSLEHTTKPEPRRDEVHRALQAIVPANCRDRTTRIYALESNEPGVAIRQAAARLDADAICVGRRGRSNLSHVLLGSISEDVLARADRPVLLAQAPRD